MAVSKTMVGSMGSAEELIKEQGNTFYREGRYQEALKCYENAISINESFKEAWLNRGMCYVQLKQTPEAIAAFRRALEIDPNYKKARYHLDVLQLSAHILFGIVDLKFTSKGQVKLLEFGEGLSSNFSGYDRLYPESPMLEKKFIDALEKIKPFFTVFNDDPERAKKELEAFSKRHHSSKAALSSRKLSDYKGVFFEIARERVPLIPNKDILVLDNSVSWKMVTRDKYMMHQVAVQSCQNYRPRCKAYPLGYENGLADKIKADIPEVDFYVLKAPDLSRGEGVIIVKPEDLEGMLKKLLCDNHNPSEEISPWRSTKSKVFLVEEYCGSKELRLQGKSYDPTMRVAFIITVNEGRANFTPLGCYWKLPKTPSSEGSLRERTISHLTLEGFGSAKVSLEDQKEVYQQLRKFLPTLFLEILVLNIPKMIEDLQGDPENLMKKQAHFLIALYSKMLMLSGEAEKAFQFIKRLKSEEPARYYTEKAGFYFRSENFEKVIKKCNKSLELNRTDSNTFFLRSKAHERLGNVQQSKSDYADYKRFSTA